MGGAQTGMPPGMPSRGPTQGAGESRAAHDELARVRARLEAAERELGRMRRRARGGSCSCRDEAAQAWADNDILHDQLRRYRETHDAQAHTIRELRGENEALRAQIVDHVTGPPRNFPPAREAETPRHRWWGDPRWKGPR